MLMLEQDIDGFAIRCGASGPIVLRHSASNPAFALGTGAPDIFMYRGNFKLTDKGDPPKPLRHASITKTDTGQWHIEFSEALVASVRLSIDISQNRLLFTVAPGDPANRLWATLPATPDEHIWGAGEQMSYFNLCGEDSPRHFPLWTSEPGVGRDKNTAITQMADLAHAGGDYWTTNYPQPTFLSSAGYACHVDSTAYTAFDFRKSDSHQIEIWQIPAAIEFFAGDTPDALVRQMATRFGQPPALPAWSTVGAIIGLKQGDASFDRLANMRKAGVAVSGLWCEDWCGIRETSFGTRLFWDWQWNANRYTDLPGRIAALARDNIRFLGYTNPYLTVDGPQFAAARNAGFLALQQDANAPYAVDFGEFEAGVVDFTNPAAADWFGEEIIGKAMIDFDLSGWMADFGEYLPTDVRLHDGSDPLLAHNAWPVKWAKVNADAVAKRGRSGDILFFMRAGHSGVQAYNQLLWAGDQSVDFSRHDGIGTVITAALSAGMLGNPYHHSDVGGYTSLGFVRTAELILRWSELGAFSPVMRTHEGNRPRDNLQVDSSPEVLAHFAAFTRVHAALSPYVQASIAQTVATGCPLQRAIFIDYPECREAYSVQDQYLYGPDLLVAPVIEEGATSRRILIPAGRDWVHLWGGQSASAGWQDVQAPIGQPPVFYAADSAFAPLFEDIARDHAAFVKAASYG
jgi:sulfoquinovosidase